MLYSSNLSNNWTATIAFSVFIEFNAVKLKYQQNPVFIPSIFFIERGLSWMLRNTCTFDVVLRFSETSDAIQRLQRSYIDSWN